MRIAIESGRMLAEVNYFVASSIIQKCNLKKKGDTTINTHLHNEIHLT